MIICVYHGSSFKQVNETQTRLITEYVKSAFSANKVVEAYYSSHVLKVMERRKTPLYSFQQAITDNYQSEERIYLLITNMMNGEEYQNILKFIKEVDVDNKVVCTNYILSEEYKDQVAEVLTADRNVLYIGHGNHIDNSDYKALNERLIVSECYVTTLKEVDKKLFKQGIMDNVTFVKPLMLTCAYHAKDDINNKFRKLANDNGFYPNFELDGLAANKDFRNLLVNNLKKIIK